MSLEKSETAGIEFLQALILLVKKNPDITCARILENWRGTRYEKRLVQLAPGGQSRYGADETCFESSDFLQSEFLGIIYRLEDGERKKRLVEFNTVSSTAKLTKEQKEFLKNLNPAARRPGQK